MLGILDAGYGREETCFRPKSKYKYIVNNQHHRMYTPPIYRYRYRYAREAPFSPLQGARITNYTMERV